MNNMEDVRKELRAIAGALKGYAELQEFSGIKEFFGRMEEPSAQPQAGKMPALPTSGFEMGSNDRLLDKLWQEVSACQRCPLCKTKTNYVFGQGNAQAKLVFVGEAPGREEDIQGLPFVGEAGALLTRIIEAMGLKRQDVYICNVLKCRPPLNRNPLPEEVAFCRGYLKRQLEIIRPRVICCLGKFACSTLMGGDISITRVRGVWTEYNGIKLMPTFHPAYLLRNPSAKKLVWEDVQKIMKELL